MENKIQTFQQLGATVSQLQKKRKRIVHCHGVFDLIHPGHVKHFTAAKKMGDVLIVTVTADAHVHKGPGRPIFPDKLRAEVLASLAAVDFVAVNDAPDAVPAINVIRPAIFVKGNEFDNGKDIHGGIAKEITAVKAVGGTVHFTNEETFSSTKLINNFFAPYPEPAQEFLRDFRANYTFEDIQSYFEKIKGYKVLVIGEVIIDEYHYVQAMNKSPKEVIVATRYKHQEAFAGGTAACANHIAGYCTQVDLISCLGAQDTREKFIRSRLKSNIKPTFFTVPDMPTIVKRRFVEPAFLTKMFEVYYFNDAPTPTEIEKKMIAHLEKVLPRYDLVIAVDYGHGFFTPRLINLLSRKAKFLALNTQTNSANFGFHLATKYPRADYLCIDHLEARLIARQKDVASKDEWRKIISGLSKTMKTRYTTVTLGHEGCLVHDGKELYKTPVLSTRVLDRVGAGDAFLAVTAPLARAGMPAKQLGFIGNAVGAVAVTIVGNREAVEPAPLFKSISTMLKA